MTTWLARASCPSTKCLRLVDKRLDFTSSSIIRRHSSTATTSHNGRPFRMAVIGSGPAGFYTAYRVMSLVTDAKVDMYEALPVPFGLVRFGVAPDHPEVKNCQEKFEEVASSPNFTFIGNVSVGAPSTSSESLSIPLESLKNHYDAILFAYGASKDRKLGIPGEDDLKGIYSAREFVGWYNGLPEFADLNPDLTQGEDVVVIGQGNVALDVARILLEDVDVLRKSDITEYALEHLAQSKVKRVRVVGRRGPMQAAFTIREVRELMKLEDVAFDPIDMSLVPNDLKTLPRAPRRLLEVLAKGTTSRLESSLKSWSADFCLSPQRFESSTRDPQSVASTTFERTALSSPFDPQSTIKGTGDMTTLPSSMVFRSVGYKSLALPEFDSLQIPFDERRGIIQNDGLGRVIRQVRTTDGAMTTEPNPGLYCAGWVKRGPTGVIASTMEDAFTTAAAIAHDHGAGMPGLAMKNGNSIPKGWEGVQRDVQGGLGSATVVNWKGWQRIDQAERERGRERGKEREKFAKTADMLAVLA